MDLAVADGEGFHEEVRHVADGDLDRLRAALAGELDKLRARRDAGAGLDVEEDRAVGALGIDEQLHFLAGRILGLLRHEFDLREAIVASVIRAAADDEEHAAFLLAAFGVLHFGGDTILAGLRRAELHLRHAILVRRDVLTGDFLLLRLALFVVAEFEQRRTARALHALLIQRHRTHADLDGVADFVVPAVGPCRDGEWLARHEHLAAAENGAAAFIGDLHADLVAMVLVAVQFFGQ